MTIDILMITYNRSRYTQMSIEQLLSTLTPDSRLWIWHNGDDTRTLDVVQSFANDSRIARIHHSEENAMLRVPTNWFWEHAEGDLVGKVDDDCLVPDGWLESLTAAHGANPDLGVLACWPFLPEDYRPDLAERKLCSLAGGGRLLQNCWTGGSGYLMKRETQHSAGPLRQDESFTDYCLRLARSGWQNGWLYPFLYMDHMDDPRSPHTNFVSDEAFAEHTSLSSRRFGTQSLEQLRERAVKAAIEVQAASPDVRSYFGWRRVVRSVRSRLSGQARRAHFSP